MTICVTAIGLTRSVMASLHRLPQFSGNKSAPFQNPAHEQLLLHQCEDRSQIYPNIEKNVIIVNIQRNNNNEDQRKCYLGKY